VEGQFREFLPIWKESSMRDSITLDCFSGLLPFNLKQKRTEKEDEDA
jgi:hypothetical protein